MRHYARAYWRTRYLAQTQPELVHELLKQRLRAGELDARIATALELAPEDLWRQVDSRVAAHFLSS